MIPCIWFFFFFLYSSEGKRLQRVTCVSLEVVGGGVGAETAGNHPVDLTHNPSLGGGGGWGFTGSPFHIETLRLCLFLQSASEGKFLPFEPEEESICSPWSPVNLRQNNDSGSQKTSIPIDFLAPLWHPASLIDNCRMRWKLKSFLCRW